MKTTVPLITRFRGYIRADWRSVALKQAGWVAIAFAGQQVLRLVTNIILARLLAPQLLGTMVIINTLRTGGELLTDVGIGQSIINHPDGATPRFYNTAWTIQIIRGVILFLVSLLVTLPVVYLYDSPDLLQILPAAATVFIITGATSPSLFLLQKSGGIKHLAIFDLCCGVASSLIHVGLALFSPSIWALVLGLLFSTLFSTSGSHVLMKGVSCRIHIDRKHLRDIFGFGKWVFLSTLIYFLSMNFDRLYFAKAIPIAMLGVYGVARTYADAAALLTQRVAYYVVFPRIAASAKRGTELRSVVSTSRLFGLIALAAGLAIGITLSGPVIRWLYDSRYDAAGWMLPVMLVGVWFTILASLADAIMLGIGKPAYVAVGNLAKLLCVVMLLPQMLNMYGIMAAIVALVLGDVVRYLALTALNLRENISFVLQDVVCTAVFFLMVIIFQVAAIEFGLAGAFNVGRYQ